MKRISIIVLVAVTVVAAFAGIWALIQSSLLERRISNKECVEKFDRCENDCRLERSRRFAVAGVQRQNAATQYQTARLLCNMLSPNLQTGCRERATEEFLERLEAASNIERRAIDAYRFCRLDCAKKGARCQDRADIVSNVVLPVHEGFPGRGDMVPVPEICTRISGDCGGCFSSLCPNMDFKFEGNLPFETEILVYDYLTDSSNVIGRGVKNGNQNTIRLQKEVKLNPGESMFVRFIPEGNKAVSEINIRLINK